MLEVILALVLAALITVALGYTARSVLSRSETTADITVLSSLIVEIERVRATNAGTLPIDPVAQMRATAGLSLTAGASNAQNQVSVASDGVVTAALAMQDGDGCVYLVYDATTARYGRDDVSAFCSAVSALGAAATITGSASEPTAVNLG